MKNRPAPRSYAANGGEVHKIERKAIETPAEPTPDVRGELADSEEERARIEAELAKKEAELEKAIAEQTLLTEKVNVLKEEAKGKAEVVIVQEDEEDVEGDE
ncbi:MAG: hypothetical protein ACYTKD_30165 [Planctomycetota bacterium]|jgi:hypothetical protein